MITAVRRTESSTVITDSKGKRKEVAVTVRITLLYGSSMFLKLYLPDTDD